MIKTAPLNTEKLLSLPFTQTKREEFLEVFRDAYAILKEGMQKDPNNAKVKTIYEATRTMFYYTMYLEHSEDMARHKVRELEDRLVQMKIKYEECCIRSCTLKNK